MLQFNVKRYKKIIKKYIYLFLLFKVFYLIVTSINYVFGTVCQQIQGKIIKKNLNKIM